MSSMRPHGFPKAVLVISAHWEEANATLTSGDVPQLIYDYSGFPARSYTYEYPAHGDTPLASKAAAMLQTAGVDAATSPRGWDHGVCVPMMLAFPGANVPIVQLSLLSSYDPGAALGNGACAEAPEG